MRHLICSTFIPRPRHKILHTLLLGENAEYQDYTLRIVGHSLGAGVAPKMATALARHNIAVAYVAMLDPVEPTQVGGEVEEIINYYLPKKKKDNKLYASSDFSGELDNVNPRKFGDIDHFNIDENRNLKGVILTKIVEYAKEPAE